MLGRTHAAIGAVASVAATPLILHVPWDSLRQMAKTLVWHGIPGGWIAQVLLVIAAIVGSLLPDLDQRNSLAAQKVERVGQIVVFLLMAALMFLLHWQTHWILWGVVIVGSFALGANSDTSRRIGLAVLGVGLLYLALRGRIPMAGAFLIAAWIVGAMFTAHRTFTHSLFGSVLFITGAFIVFHALGRVYGVPVSVAAWGLAVGYVLHMVADGVAGGIPLLWPWNERQGIGLVNTGGALDQAIGMVAVLAFLGFVVL